MTSTAALVVGERRYPFHDITELRPHVEAAFGDTANLRFTTSRDDLLDLSSYDVLVDYLTDSTLTNAQLDALTGFVAGGGGYLGVHCAADLTSVHGSDGGLDSRTEPFPDLQELLGGHFRDHPEQSTFGVDIVDGTHPVTDGVDRFEVFDEPYQVEVNDDVTVLATMDHPDLDAYPVVWVRTHGEGRVCYASLGHTEDAFAHYLYRRLLRNAVGWVADS